MNVLERQKWNLQYPFRSLKLVLMIRVRTRILNTTGGFRQEHSNVRIPANLRHFFTNIMFSLHIYFIRCFSFFPSCNERFYMYWNYFGLQSECIICDLMTFLNNISDVVLSLAHGKCSENSCVICLKRPLGPNSYFE